MSRQNSTGAQHGKVTLSIFLNGTMSGKTNLLYGCSERVQLRPLWEHNTHLVKCYLRSVHNTYWTLFREQTFAVGPLLPLYSHRAQCIQLARDGSFIIFCSEDPETNQYLFTETLLAPRFSVCQLVCDNLMKYN